MVAREWGFLEAPPSGVTWRVAREWQSDFIKIKARLGFVVKLLAQPVLKPSQLCRFANWMVGRFGTTLCMSH